MQGGGPSNYATSCDDSGLLAAQFATSSFGLPARRLLLDEASAANSTDKFPLSLKDQLQRELNLSRCRRGGSDLTHAHERCLLIRSQNGGGPSKYRRGRRHAEVGMVQDVEDLRAELNGSLFAQQRSCCVFDERKIPIPQIWPT
jgi:hypothetical protein